MRVQAYSRRATVPCASQNTLLVEQSNVHDSGASANENANGMVYTGALYCFETIARPPIQFVTDTKQFIPWQHATDEGSFMQRTQVRYTGRVQGVGFRATCRHISTGFPVTGWVQNEPDGTVLLEAQGTTEAVEQFLIEVTRVLGRNIENEFKLAVPAIPNEGGFIIRR